MEKTNTMDEMQVHQQQVKSRYFTRTDRGCIGYTMLDWGVHTKVHRALSVRLYCHTHISTISVINALIKFK